MAYETTTDTTTDTTTETVPTTDNSAADYLTKIDEQKKYDAGFVSVSPVASNEYSFLNGRKSKSAVEQYMDIQQPLTQEQEYPTTKQGQGGVSVGEYSSNWTTGGVPLYPYAIQQEQQNKIKRQIAVKNMQEEQQKNNLLNFGKVAEQFAPMIKRDYINGMVNDYQILKDTGRLAELDDPNSKTYKDWALRKNNVDTLIQNINYFAGITKQFEDNKKKIGDQFSYVSPKSQKLYDEFKKGTLDVNTLGKQENFSEIVNSLKVYTDENKRISDQILKVKPLADKDITSNIPNGFGGFIVSTEKTLSPERAERYARTFVENPANADLYIAMKMGRMLTGDDDKMLNDKIAEIKQTLLDHYGSTKDIKGVGNQSGINVSYSDGGANYGDVVVSMNPSPAVYVNSDTVQSVLKDKNFQEKYQRAVETGETRTAEQYAVEAARGKDNHTFIYVEKKDAPEKELSFVIDKDTKMFLDNQGVSLDENMIKGTLVGLENTPDGLKGIVKYQYGDKKTRREYTDFGENTDAQGKKYNDVYENPKYVQVTVPFEGTSNEAKIRGHYTDKKTGKGISDFLQKNKKLLDEEFKVKPTELGGKNQGKVSKPDRKAKAEKNLEGF